MDYFSYWPNRANTIQSLFQVLKNIVLDMPVSVVSIQNVLQHVTVIEHLLIVLVEVWRKFLEMFHFIPPNCECIVSHKKSFIRNKSFRLRNYLFFRFFFLFVLSLDTTDCSTTTNSVVLNLMAYLVVYQIW